jgi:integrase
MPRPTSSKYFRVFKLASPNGRKEWKAEGRPTGKRERYYFATEKEARAAALDLNNQIAAFGTRNNLTDTERVMASECLAMLAPYGKTLYEAVHFYREYLDRLASSVSVRAVCERVGAEFERRLAAGEISTPHALNMRETLRKFEGRFGTTPVKLLDGGEVKAWLAALPLAVKTRNRHLGYVRNVFGLAREWNLVEKDPFERVNGFHDPHRRARQVAILAPDQLGAFLRAVDPDFLPYFAISAFSGLRRGEILRLDWSEVKLERGLIDLPFAKSKNRRRKLIEVAENLKAWLAPFVRESGPLRPRKRLQLALERAAKAAGIVPWPQNVLRHSFCSYAVALRGFEWTSAQADHSVAMLRRHYWEVVSKEDARRYWEIVPADCMALNRV